MTSSAITAHDLTVARDGETILRGLDFTVPAGTITGLIGPSGSGKTTLMRTIIGVQKYDGEISVLSAPAGHKSLRRKIGYVSQSPAVYDDLTVAQNLAYFGAIVSADRSMVATVLQQVEMGRYKQRLVRNLSGGQRARVSLAIALLGNPELLVLDEPTVGLDPLLREELWGLFAKSAAEGKTLLVSSHVMDEAERCEQLMLMRDGGLLWNDSRAQLLDVTKCTDVGSAFIQMIREGK